MNLTWRSSSFTFCDIEGGYSGEGNIDAEPEFIDSEQYILDENSPCVDAGDPQEIYNDPEDPSVPGQAQYPAQGGLRNDMGAFGGPLTSCWEYTSSHSFLLPSPNLKLWNYPNPLSFDRSDRNSGTTISFELNKTADVELSLYNLKGQKVYSFKQEHLKPGEQEIIWYGQDNEGKIQMPGIYVYKLTMNNKFAGAGKCMIID